MFPVQVWRPAEQER